MGPVRQSADSGLMDFNTRCSGLISTHAAVSRGICRGIGSELGQKHRLDTPQEFDPFPIRAVSQLNFFAVLFKRYCVMKG